MDYEKKYKDLVEAVKELQEANPSDEGIQKWVEDNIPELSESESEKIRKFLIQMAQNGHGGDKDWWNKCVAWLEKQVEKFIPEDIEKAALQYVDTCAVDGKITHNNVTEPYWNNHSMMNAYKAGWLERQGEQKPTDKVEPKFHEGEWITNGDYTWQIVSVTDLDYILQSQDGNVVDDTISYVDEQFHSFTIEDAKNGDVLVSESTCGLGTWYCIFKSLDGDESMTVYCYLTRDGRFETKKELCFDKDPRNVKPATKEQRDQLEKAMVDAGYKWNPDEKKLKKIEQKPLSSQEVMDIAIDKDFGQDELEPVFEIKTSEESLSIDSDTYNIVVDECIYNKQKPAWSEEDEDYLKAAIWYAENPAPMVAKNAMLVEWLKNLRGRVLPQPQQEWSEEDEKMFRVINDSMEYLNSREAKNKSLGIKITFCKTYIQAINWFKSLKERVQPQPKQGWSKEDEEHVNSLLKRLKGLCRKEFATTRFAINEDEDWLKSLKHQYKWKPSDEQMEALNDVISSRDIKYDVLSELWKDLKKLRKE